MPVNNGEFFAPKILKLACIAHYNNRIVFIKAFKVLSMTKNFKLLIIVFTMTTTNVKAQNGSVTYPLVASFNSIGTGVPNDAPLVEYITCFKKSNKIKTIVASRIGPLGREGEYKLAFSLKEMNKALQACFIKGVEATAKKMNDRGSALITTNEKINFANLPARSAPVKTQY